MGAEGKGGGRESFNENVEEGKRKGQLAFVLYKKEGTSHVLCLCGLGISARYHSVLVPTHRTDVCKVMAPAALK